MYLSRSKEKQEMEISLPKCSALNTHTHTYVCVRYMHEISFYRFQDYFMLGLSNSPASKNCKTNFVIASTL